MRTQLTISVLMLGSIFSGLSRQACALQQATQINRIEDVIERWTPEQHLYVKGDVGVGGVQFAELEQWLDEHAPHWTIVLMQSAGGEQYTGANGIRYTGMDAVEYALGYGLANRTGFGQLENPITHETDGAVFVLFLTERKFSYYASEAQDRRGLGEARWVGELDQPAIRAMRGGGRILDAVKDTVTSIDTRLDRLIDSETAAAERAARERERSLAELKSDLQHAREAVQTASAKASELRSTLPAAEGPMLNPPIDAWNRRLQQIDEDLTADNVRESSQKASELMTEIDRHLNWFAQYDAYTTREADLNEQIAVLKTELGGVASSNAEQAETWLAEARTARANGDPAFVEQLQSASQVVQTGYQAVQKERDDRARREARRRLIWSTALVTLALAAVALAVFLYWLNRRRAATREEALKALAERQKSVRAEMDRVLQLFDRSREILGTKENIEARGYVGQTKQLADGAFRNVDELLIMSNEVDRVMSEVQDLVRPGGLFGMVQNQFSATRYERGMNRMSGEPLSFHEDQGIPAILEPDQTDASGNPPEVISRTFEQVFSAFRKRSDDVSSALDIVEKSLLDVSDELDQLAETIQKATDIDKQLASAAEEDGFFHVPDFFDVLLPSAEVDHDQADELAPSDPVRASRELVPRGVRKIKEAMQIATSIQTAREKEFPKFDQQAPRLKALGYDTSWIQARLVELGEQANQLFRAAAEQSVAEQATQFDAEIASMGSHVEQCADLAEALQKTAEPSIDSLAAQINAARQQVSERIHLPVEVLLREEQTNPDDRLGAAREQLAAARASLQRGGLEAAASASDTLQAEIDQGRQIVDYSLEVLHRFDGSLGDARGQHQSVQSSMPAVGDLVQRTTEEYAETALRLQACDASYPDSQATLASRFHEAQVSLNESWELLDQAEHAFREGKLLDADGRNQVALARIHQSTQWLTDIRKHVDGLEDRKRQNEVALGQIAERAHELETRLRDPRTTLPTLDQYDRVQQQIQAASREVVEARVSRDPFENAEQLQQMNTHLSKVEGLMESDRRAFAEAARAVAGAVHQLSAAQQLVDQARRDGIPDSDVTVHCVREIKRLESQLDTVRHRLDDTHADWSLVDQDAARLNAELGTQAARLKGELDRAQKSVEALEQASREVFEAARWNGRYGVRVNGSPGAQDLEHARQALSQGNYDLMVQLSRAAATAAQFAVQHAEREVLRQQREEARRAEAARRAEMARRRRSQPSISIGSGGLGGGFGGGFRGGGGGGGGETRVSADPVGSRPLLYAATVESKALRESNGTVKQPPQIGASYGGDDIARRGLHRSIQSG